MYDNLIQKKNGSFILLEFASSLNPYSQMFCCLTSFSFPIDFETKFLSQCGLKL